MENKFRFQMNEKVVIPTLPRLGQCTITARKFEYIENKFGISFVDTYLLLDDKGYSFWFPGDFLLKDQQVDFDVSDKVYQMLIDMHLKEREFDIVRQLYQERERSNLERLNLGK